MVRHKQSFTNIPSSTSNSDGLQTPEKSGQEKNDERVESSRTKKQSEWVESSQEKQSCSISNISNTYSVDLNELSERMNLCNESRNVLINLDEVDDEFFDDSVTRRNRQKKSFK